MSHIRDQWQSRKWRALILNQGSLEFINQCKAEVVVVKKLSSKIRDPEVSERNLEALRNGSLDFEVSYAIQN